MDDPRSSAESGPDDLAARSGLARFLAGLFAGDPDPGGPPAPGSLAEPAERLVDAARAADPTVAETERVRLFVNASGGVPAPPYASWWLDGTLGGPSADDVAALYLEEGLRGGQGSPDYLPAELEFMHFLLQHQVAARGTESPALEDAARRRERRFLDDHLLRWLPAFARATRRATDDPFWTAAVDLLEAFVADEARRARTFERPC